MSNHLHLVISTEDNNPSDILRDFKEYTSKQIIKITAVVRGTRTILINKTVPFRVPRTGAGGIRLSIYNAPVIKSQIEKPSLNGCRIGVESTERSVAK